MTYEIQCRNTMGDAIFIETSERKAMRRAKVYAGDGLLGQARVDVRCAKAGDIPVNMRIGGYHLGADGKVRRVS